MDPAVSGDGQWLAYATGDKNLDLWIRPVEGGDARRMTNGAADEYQPSLSADGSLLAYRSEAGGGGVYVLPANGGKSRLLASGAERPRFAPTGTRLVYVEGNRIVMTDAAQPKPRAVLPDFHSASAAVWSADGQRLLVHGCRDSSATTCDWWVTSPEAPGATATGVARLFRAAVPAPGAWLASGEVLGTSQNKIWRVALAEGSWQAKAAPQRLTAGAEPEATPAALPDGRVIYTRPSENIDVWVLPIEAGKARARGALTRVTSDPAIEQRPTLSTDGKRIAWETTLGGNFEVWVKDLATGQARGITDGPLREHMPAITRDGSSLVYDAHDGDKVTVFRAAFAGGAPVKVVEENVGHGSFQFAAGGDSVLYFHRAPPGTVGLMDLATGKRTVLLRHPKLNLSLADARLSPDGRLIAFPAPYAPHRSRLAIAPVSGKVIADENDWTYLTPEQYNAHQPEWSPDGRWLYFLSDESGKLGIAALRMSGDGNAQGRPKAVLLLPGPRLSINGMRPRDIGLAVAADKLAFGAAETSGTLWSVKLP